MADKAGQLRKRLIINAALCVVACLILSGGGYMLSSYEDDAETAKQQKDSETSGLRGELGSLQSEIDTGAEVQTYYNAYVTSHNDSFVLNREATMQALAALREKNHLEDLSVTISPITEVGGTAAPKLRSGTLVRSDVHLTFSALTDASVFELITDMQSKLPGIVMVSEVKLSRSEELSRNILMSLSQHKILPMVTGDISFVWLGIRPTETPDKTPTTPGPGAAR